jgi:hypothetical protein
MTQGSTARGPILCRCRAQKLLPAPLSPVSSTGASAAATRSSVSPTARIGGEVQPTAAASAWLTGADGRAAEKAASLSSRRCIGKGLVR